MIAALLVVLILVCVMGAGTMTEQGRRMLAVPLRPVLEYSREVRFGFEMRKLEAEEKEDEQERIKFHKEMKEIRSTAAEREREYMLEWEKKLNGGVLPAHLQPKTVHDVQTYVAPLPISYTPYQIQTISNRSKYTSSVTVHEPEAVVEVPSIEGSVIVRYEDDPTAWIALKRSISRGAVEDALRHAPRNDTDTEGAKRFLAHLRGKLLTGWSLTGFGGEGVPLSESVFSQLNAAAANWIDQQVAKHFAELIHADKIEISIVEASPRPTSDEVLKYVPSAVPLGAVETYKELFRCMYEQEAAKTLGEYNLDPESLLAGFAGGVQGLVNLHRKGADTESEHYAHVNNLFDTKTAQIQKLYEVPDDLLLAYMDAVISNTIEGE